MKKILFFLIGAFALGFGLAAMWNVLFDTTVGGTIVGQVVQHATGGNTDLAEVANVMLGFDRPRNYLILFLNNTELRPGGGFIGAYAVGTMASAHLDLINVDGTEILDGSADRAKLIDPPKVVGDHLKVSKWFFRDSNWSPDYEIAAKQSLDFYKRENGYLADKIDAVIAFTPTVIEQFLKINGPITVDGVTFTASNVTEQLEYQVEYAYKNQGKSMSERKSVLRDFSIALIKKAKVTGLWEAKEYLNLAATMLAQKQILLYSPDQTLQNTIRRLGYGGTMTSTGSDGDYLLWADANLGALKTDWAIARSLSYAIAPSGTSFSATIAMHYAHTKPRDWRTSIYMDYVRVYVPIGTTLTNVTVKNSTGTTSPAVDKGTENGRAWFGTYITVSPQTSADVTWQVQLAPSVAAAIGKGSYTLAVDKELGTIAPALTLGLDFGKKVVAASPGETTEHLGDNRYDIATDLSIDRTFNVSLERTE